MTATTHEADMEGASSAQGLPRSISDSADRLAFKSLIHEFRRSDGFGDSYRSRLNFILPFSASEHMVFATADDVDSPKIASAR